jgi:serine/threonine protein kinase/tetratricopeptide (TPR) repeat protein
MLPGDVVSDRFEILGKAGSGGMGVVYRAHDRTTGRDVALKILLESEGKLADRFGHEIELLSTIRHPRIVGYVTHGTNAAGAPYLVMPWLEGHDLQGRLRGGPLSVEETVFLARGVADALAYLHGRGLVHRDLKPSNLFLPEGKIEDVQVIDLGIARATVPEQPLTLSGTLVGTPGFVAPELALGDREILPTVDVFALGCVLFECLAGQRLFRGRHLMAILAKILVEEAPRLRELRPDVPEALDRLIQRMVAKEPDRRPRDGAQLLRWIEGIAASDGSLRPSPPSITTAERRVVCVLVAVLPSVHTQTEGSARSGIDVLCASSDRFGVRVQPLDARTAIALASDGLAAADQASILARFGRHVDEVFPGSSLALATGGAVTAARLPAGDAIDRGVTLVREAKAGRGVHVDDVSAALLTSRFDLRREGGYFLLADERLSLDPTRPLLGRPTSCVGRDREFAVLDATWAECVEGAGPKVVLVTAAAGAGKSRVRHEFLRRLRASSAASVQVLKCRGDLLHVATPYALVAQAVRQGAGLHDQEPLEVAREKLTAHLADLLPDHAATRIAAFLGELVGVPFSDDTHVALRAARHSGEAMSDQIRLAFEATMRAWCQRQPVVLVLEDLHWGDAASVKLLDGALRKLGGAPLLLLALARPAVHERFPALWSKRDVTEIRLPPLSRHACVQLVREVVGDAVDEDDVGTIVRRSEGNAFYLEELIREAAERKPPPSARRSSLHNDLPETVIAMAQARLERLEPTARKVLRAASIYGEVFAAEDVKALVGEDAASLDAALAALVEHEAIGPSEQLRTGTSRVLIFRHTFLRGAAYAMLTEDDRALGHRLAAQWLEQKDEDREIVALHWLEGGEPGRASACFAQAAQARLARAQPDAAARCAVRSLLVMSDGRQEAPESIAERIGFLDSALKAARRIDGHEVIAGIVRHVMRPEQGSESSFVPTVVHVALERSLQGLGGAADGGTTSIALARAASALAALSDFTRAKELLERALSLASDDAERLQEIRWVAARVASWAMEYGEATEILNASVLPADARERLEMLLILAPAVVAVGGDEALSGGLECVSRAEELVSASGDDPVARVHCAKARVLCFGLAGQHARAVEAAEKAVELSRHAGLRYEECAHLHNMGEQYLHLGESERARTALTSSLEIARDIGAEHPGLYDEALLAYLDADSARLEEIADGFRVANLESYERYTRYWFGRLLAREGASRARREFARGLDLARKLNVRRFADQCSWELANLPTGT